MHGLLLFLCVVLSTPYSYQASKALVELDEHSFDKLLNKFDAALVKFDVAYPYGDKHEAFSALALEAKDVDELLVADVNVKDYGEKDNEALALKYGATKDNFPVVKLFIKGKTEPISFDAKEFNSEELRKFVREQTGLYLSVPGCVKQLDQLADKFMDAGQPKREYMLTQIEAELQDLLEKHKESGEIYKTIMKKIVDKGDGFVKTEVERVKKITAGKLSEEKKKKLSIRLNILQTFQLALEKKNKGKEDLQNREKVKEDLQNEEKGKEDL